MNDDRLPDDWYRQTHVEGTAGLGEETYTYVGNKAILLTIHFGSQPHRIEIEIAAEHIREDLLTLSTDDIEETLDMAAKLMNAIATMDSAFVELYGLEDDE